VPCRAPCHQGTEEHRPRPITTMVPGRSHANLSRCSPRPPSCRCRAPTGPDRTERPDNTTTRAYPTARDRRTGRTRRPRSQDRARTVEAPPAWPKPPATTREACACTPSHARTSLSPPETLVVSTDYATAAVGLHLMH
jgi:hypothetical protein